jgi:hypothetical protein
MMLMAECAASQIAAIALNYIESFGMTRTTLFILKLRLKFTIRDCVATDNLLAMIASFNLKSLIIESSAPSQVVTAVEAFFISPTFPSGIKHRDVLAFVACADATFSCACFAGCALSLS